MERTLRRSRTDRMLFGVAGGLGKYLDVDPVIVRVVFVVLGFMGWGILAYLALAVLTPQEDAAPAAPAETARQNVQAMAAEAAQAAARVSQEAAKRGLDQRRAVALGVLLVLAGAFILASNLGWLGLAFWADYWPVALIALGGFLLLTVQGRKAG